MTEWLSTAQMLVEFTSESIRSKLFLCQKILLTDLISLLVIGQKRFFITLWLSLGRLCVSRNAYLSSRFSHLLEYSCSQYPIILLFISIKSIVLYPLSFLILVTRVFSLLFLCQSLKDYQLCWPLQIINSWLCRCSLFILYSLFYLSLLLSSLFPSSDSFGFNIFF